MPAAAVPHELRDAVTVPAPDRPDSVVVAATWAGSVRDPSVAAHFRQVLGHFATGLTLLTSRGRDGAPIGMTIQALMSLSLDPPLIALGVGRHSRSWERVRRAGGRFRLNLLTTDQAELAWQFGRYADGEHRFTGSAWRIGPAGLPELVRAHAWIDAAVRDEHDGGDHVLVVASVGSLRVGAGEPLIFHRGRPGRLAGP
ncbi:flavin reductase family protein [Plantactinospora siamensis]|uniref:Flavin reductase family protein n=1 Tax=Plantactinospora siamensis TaxID=555372 RepID=A0ABV6NQG8_9ACTN